MTGVINHGRVVYSATDTDRELAAARAWDKFTAAGHRTTERPHASREWQDDAGRWHVEFVVYPSGHAVAV